LPTGTPPLQNHPEEPDTTLLVKSEHLFYHREVESPEPRLADVEYLEVQCKSALNPVKGMGFAWSLNPYTGCEHRCGFEHSTGFRTGAGSS
jgi:hypothetical protein